VTLRKDLATYVGMLLRDSATTALVVIDAIGYGLAMAVPKLALVPQVYAGVLVAAVVVGGFKIYRRVADQREQMAARVAELETSVNALREVRPQSDAALQAAIATVAAPPSLVVQSVEGAEYEYSVQTPFQDHHARFGKPTDDLVTEEKDYQRHYSTDYSRPVVRLVVHLRIRNTGSHPADIVAIDVSVKPQGELNPDSDPFAYFDVVRMTDVNGHALSYPVRIAPHEVLRVDARISILLIGSETVARLAARLGALGDTFEDFVTGEATVEAPGPDRKIHRFSTALRIAVHPLRDGLINYWRATGSTELVRLATGASPHTKNSHGRGKTPEVHS
jgi:hypothetical protein